MRTIFPASGEWSFESESTGVLWMDELDFEQLREASVAWDCNDTSYAVRDVHLKAMGFFDYASYLESDLWRFVRKSFMSCLPEPSTESRDFRRQQCWVCMSPSNLHVHHSTYSLPVLVGNILGGHFTIRMDDLQVLCSRCHVAVEFDPSGNKLTLAQVNFRLFAAKQRHWQKKIGDDYSNWKPIEQHPGMFEHVICEFDQ